MSLLSVPLAELRERRSLKWQVYASDVLPMWVAEMDTDLHPAVRATLKAAIDRGDTGYPYGTAYAEAFAAMADARWGWQLDVAAQVRRAGDVMNSILAVLEATTSRGDAVVINPPVYPPFRQVVGGYGRRIVEAPLTPSGRLDAESLAAAFGGSDGAANDDGEPSGTAGRPMLDVLRHQDLQNVLATVVRYFGGVKLGAGGLVRAYTDAVAQALLAAEKLPVQSFSELGCRFAYPHEGLVRRLAADAGAEILEVRHASDVHLLLRVNDRERAALRAGISSATQGQARFDADPAPG